MIVTSDSQDHRVISFDSFDVVPPLSCYLHRQVRDFGARVHGECHVIPEQLRLIS